MKTMISALHFPWQTVAECFTRAHDELGLDGVELSLPGQCLPPECPREAVADLRRENQRYGLTLAAHLWENLATLGSPAAERRLSFWLGVCRRAGITSVVIHGGSYPEQRAGLARTREILAAVVPEYEAAGVVLCLENHYAFTYHDCHELFSEPWEFLELLPGINSPALRFCFDTGHGHMNHNTPALLTALAPWLAHVHLADNHGIDDDHCGYGEGTVNWPECFDLLETIGYPGPLCVEFPVRGQNEALHQCLAEIRRRWPATPR